MKRTFLAFICFTFFLHFPHTQFASCTGEQISDKDFPDLELKQAIIDDNLDKVTLLVEAGANLMQRSGSQRGLLDLAAGAGSASVLKYLISKGLDVNWRNCNYIYPIMSSKNVEIVKIFIEAGANHYSIQQFAIRGASWECFEFLLDQGLININETEYGFSKLQIASASGNIELVKKLLNRGARDYDHWPSQVAAKNGHHEIVKLIQESEAKYNN